MEREIKGIGKTKNGEERMIEKMDYTADYNSMTSVREKLNEIIDVLNELTAPVTTKAEEQRTLWVNENCEVVEFCCNNLKERIIYYNIVLYTDYEKGTTTGMLETRELDSTDKLIIKHINKCPYCDASIKCKTSKMPSKYVQVSFKREDVPYFLDIAMAAIVDVKQLVELTHLPSDDSFAFPSEHKVTLQTKVRYKQELERWLLFKKELERCKEAVEK